MGTRKLSLLLLLSLLSSSILWCLLDAGYQGDGVNCRYVGVCAVSNGGCHPLAICRETPGKVHSTWLRDSLTGLLRIQGTRNILPEVPLTHLSLNLFVQNLFVQTNTGRKSMAVHVMRICV